MLLVFWDSFCLFDLDLLVFSLKLRSNSLTRSLLLSLMIRFLYLLDKDRYLLVFRLLLDARWLSFG